MSLNKQRGETRPLQVGDLRVALAAGEDVVVEVLVEGPGVHNLRGSIPAKGFPTALRTLSMPLWIDVNPTCQRFATASTKLRDMAGHFLHCSDQQSAAQQLSGSLALAHDSGRVSK